MATFALPLKRRREDDEAHDIHKKRMRLTDLLMHHDSTRNPCLQQRGTSTKWQKPREPAGALTTTAILAGLQCSSYIPRSLRNRISAEHQSDTVLKSAPRTEKDDASYATPSAGVITISTPEFQGLNILSQTAVMAGAQSSTYMPADSPPKPELMHPPSMNASAHTEQDTLQLIQGDSMRETEKSWPPLTQVWTLDAVSDIDKAAGIEYCDQVEPEQSSSLIPGIPRDYVQDFHQPSLAFTPSDIYMLRHLKPTQRQKVHQEFCALGNELCSYDVKTEQFWKTWAAIKLKTSTLRQREQHYYRVNMRRFFMPGEYDERKHHLSWKFLVIHQSFDTLVDGNGKVSRVRRAKPKQDTAQVPTNTIDFGEQGDIGEGSSDFSSLNTSFSSPETSVESITGGSFETAGRKRSAESDLDSFPGEHSKSAKVARRDVILRSAQESVAYIDLTEDEPTPASVRVRAAAKQAVDNHEKAVYQQYRDEIEQCWASDRSRAKDAPLWQKLGTWQGWRTARGKQPILMLSMQQALHQLGASRALVNTASQRAVNVTPVPSGPQLPVTKDWEDPDDESSWARCPGAETRYRCNHRAMACLEQTCSGKHHKCCKEGVDRTRKLNYLLGVSRSGKKKEKTAEEQAATAQRQADRRTKIEDSRGRRDNQKLACEMQADVTVGTLLQAPQYQPTPNVQPQQALLPRNGLSGQTADPQTATPESAVAPAQQQAVNSPAANDRQAPISPVPNPIVSVPNSLLRYRRDAEHVECRRAQHFQNWPRFNSWWDAAFRRAQGHTLTEEETQLLEQSEPSIEKRTSNQQPAATIISAGTPKEPETSGDTAMSEDDLDSLFGDDEAEAEMQSVVVRQQETTESTLATEEELLAAFEEDEEL
ncbi:hypothetical protein EJ07DRAFT_158423 [Lizonia empirigonia]|nr:hypothetical protein EJ07DRAFT_158423 [Lizonia empirigonia]